MGTLLNPHNTNFTKSEHTKLLQYDTTTCMYTH